MTPTARSPWSSARLLEEDVDRVVGGLARDGRGEAERAAGQRGVPAGGNDVDLVGQHGLAVAGLAHRHGGGPAEDVRQHALAAGARRG